MNTFPKAVTGRRRRRHSDEFKARVVEACRQPGVSLVSVALANGFNFNALPRWVVEREQAFGKAAVERPPECSPEAQFLLVRFAGPGQHMLPIS